MNRSVACHFPCKRDNSFEDAPLFSSSPSCIICCIIFYRLKIPSWLECSFVKALFQSMLVLRPHVQWNVYCAYPCILISIADTLERPEPIKLLEKNNGYENQVTLPWRFNFHNQTVLFALCSLRICYLIVALRMFPHRLPGSYLSCYKYEFLHSINLSRGACILSSILLRQSALRDSELEK